jgi:pimeloyl-ACP methyl ester carboxylesterase
MRLRRFISIFLLGFLATAAVSAQPEAKPKSNWAKLDGNKIHYYDTGNTKAKNALVLVHGWTCNAEFWKDTYNAFPQYRVIAIDLPGHGQSDKPKLDYSMEHFARSIHAVLKEAGVKNAVIAGHSLGTPVARQFYRLYPKQTLGIIIVDGPLRPLAPKADMEKFLAPMRINYAENSAKFIDGMLKPVSDRALAKFIGDNMLATPDYVALSAMDGMIDEKIWTQDKIEVPVLAVMAPLAANWPPGLKEAYTILAPNMDFHEWTGVTHFLMMERPAEFNNLVGSFISKNKLL